MSSNRSFLAVLMLLLVSGCASSRFSVPDVVRLPDLAYSRSSDSLLHRPDLQEVVDLQVLRRGAELIPFLNSDDAAVRARAAFALGSVQFEDAIPDLLGRLVDVDPRVRADAAFALGQTADSTAGPTLLQALREEGNETVQLELVEAIGETGDVDALLELIEIELPASLEPTRSLAIARFGIRGIHASRAVSHLISELGIANNARREAAAYYFGRMTDTTPWANQADSLREARVDMFASDPAIQHLVLAFGRLGDEQDFGLIGNTLHADPHWQNRANAARAIGLLEDKATLFNSDLLSALSDDNLNVAVAAATVLARIDEPSAELILSLYESEHIVRAGPRLPVTSALLPLLVNGGRTNDVMTWIDAQDSPFAAASGLRALGNAADDASLEFLFDEAENDDPRLAYASLRSLRTRWETLRESANPHIQRFYDAFAEAIESKELTSVYAAAPAMSDSLFAEFNPGELLRSTYEELEAPADTDAMTAIIRAIGEIRDGQEIDFLVDVMMQSNSPALREAAEEALNGRLVDGIEVSNRTENIPPTILIDWEQLAEYGERPLLTLFTVYGPIVIEMDAEQAPQTVQKIIRSTVRGDYDGVPFHRVVANFVIQGGDYFREDGFGGPEVAIRSEFTRIRYTTGTAGMASSGKDTEGVQYFVTHTPTPHLDGHYTAFGRVIHGQDVVDRIQVGDVVVRARVETIR